MNESIGIYGEELLEVIPFAVCIYTRIRHALPFDDYIFCSYRVKGDAFTAVK